MRLRPIIAALIVVAAAAIGLSAMRGCHVPRRPAPTGGGAVLPHVVLGAPMHEVLPMHKAVRRAAARFEGRVIDITLLAASEADRARGVQVIYRLRMVTESRDVLDIRMDALNGRFIEVRGADLSGARRMRKDKDD